MFGVFTPEQVRNQAQQRSLRDSQRARDISDTIDVLLKEQNDLEREFAESMNARRKEAEEEYEKRLQEKRALDDEIRKLEERRREALRPLLLSEQDVQSAQEALKVREDAVATAEAENEETHRALVKKINETAERARNLDERESLVKRREAGAEMQRQQVSQSAKQVNALLQKFEQEKADWDIERAHQQSEFDARKNLYDQQDARLLEREQEIEASMRLLQDQRVLLDKGFAELRKLQQQHDKRGITA